MKKQILTYAVLAVLMTAVPMIPAFASAQKQETSLPDMRTEATGNMTEITEPETICETSSPAVKPETGSRTSYLVLDKDTGEVHAVPLREYLIGALCAEMPLSFEPEALKAQAVAAHTYAERQAALSHPDEALQGAHFSNDSSRYQAFYTDTQLREMFGDRYPDCYEIASAAVDAVLHEILTYEEQPIIAAFHAISSGRTEASEHVWGTAVEYLTSVESPGDTTAPSYEQSVLFSAEEVREALTAVHTGLILGDDPALWFAEGERSEAGTVLHMAVGRSIFTGQELRTIFGLRSADFRIEYSGGEFCFTTRGYGHGVGMSQYGANAMAKEGKTYEEILAYYYPGTSLTVLDAQ